MESIKNISMEAAKAKIDNPECSRNSSDSTKSTAVQNPSGGGFVLQALGFPKFSGERPRLWISDCETYFEIVPVTDPKKVVLAALHMEAEAKNWYVYNSEELRAIPWSEFARKVCKKFSPSRDEIVSDFRKLSQEGSVEEYMGKFEELQYLMGCEFECLDGDFFMASFLSGLTDEIKYKVLMFSPKSLVEAFHLARLQEKDLESEEEEEDAEDQVPEKAVAWKQGNKKFLPK